MDSKGVVYIIGTQGELKQKINDQWSAKLTYNYLDNKHNRIYDMSQMLLTKMHNELNNTKAITITPASSWRVLKEYGGHMSIEKFRSNFGKIDYDYHGITRTVPIAHLYEEKVKFF